MKYIKSIKEYISKRNNTLTFLGDSLGSASANYGGDITGATFPSGRVIKCTFYEIGEGTLSNSSFPRNNTTPQSGEGTQIWSQSFTPDADTTDIYITAYVKIGETASLSNEMAVALFYSASSSALVVSQRNEESDAGGGLYIVNYNQAYIDYKLSSWGASAKTFQLRSSGAQRYNGFENYQQYSIGTRYNDKINSGVLFTEVS